MKTLLIAILAGGAAGVGGSLAAGALLRCSTSPAEDPAASARPAGVTRSVDELAGLRAELATLRQTNERLEARIAGLELGPRDARAPASAAENEELASLRGEVADLIFALRTPDAPPPASLQSAVRRTLEDVRQEEQRQRELEREQERIERMNQRIDRLVGELELAPYQVDGFRRAMAESEARRDAAMALARDGTDWGQARDAMRDLREQTEASMAGILTPDQLAKYSELQDPRGRGGFGGGRGNRGGGGGGGANGQ